MTHGCRMDKKMTMRIKAELMSQYNAKNRINNKIDDATEDGKMWSTAKVEQWRHRGFCHRATTESHLVSTASKCEREEFGYRRL